VDSKKEGSMQFSQHFIENVFLLLLSAGIAGFLVPYLLKLIDERRAQRQRETEDHRNREQKRFEADLARQSKIIEAQVNLLDSLSKQLWDFLLLALSISYYKFHGDEERYQKATATYETECWSLFGSLRTEISRARRLISAEMHAQLLNLYQTDLVMMDSQLTELIKKKAQRDQWIKMHERLFADIQKNTDDILNRLADELRLSVSEFKQTK
jgi:hypothetical protein